MKIILIIYFLLTVSFYCQNGKTQKLIKHTWLWGKDTLGVISIPPNYKVSNWAYGEGLVTTITFRDSSYIILHFGGTIHLPFLNTPDHKLTSIKKYENRTVRKGEVVNTNLFWCEYNFYNLTNIAYSKVSKAKIELYNQSLDSFVFLWH